MPNFKVHNLMSPDESGIKLYSELGNPENPSESDIEIMERFLKGNTHTPVLFICKNGSLALRKFMYVGGFPEFKEAEGKYFSRMDTKPKRVFDFSTKQYKNTNIHIPKPDYEIVGEYVNKKYIKRKVESVDDYEATLQDVMRFYREQHKK